MPIELKIPQVGESITEVQIVEWLKVEGDDVRRDDPIAVIDSEKTTFELPSPESGKLGKILRKAGETVAVGEVIGQLESDTKGGDPKNSKRAGKSDSSSTTKPRTDKAKVPQTELAKEATNTEKADASDNPTPIRETKPTAPSSDSKSRINKQPESKPAVSTAETTEDNESTDQPTLPAKSTEREPAGEPTSPPSRTEPSTGEASEDEVKIVPMSMLRRTVARRLTEAKQQMAMLTTFNEVDMSAVQALRQELKEAFENRHEVKLGLMSFFVKAVVDALKQVPQLNAEIRGNDIVYHKRVHIGVAVSTGRGLVVPVLSRAEDLSFATIEKSLGDFASRARDGKLKPDELQGATFTITNGGVFGSLLSTPIVSPPQSGILGMHAIQERPVALNGQVVIRPMMYVALTYDHRLVDGREAVLFLRRIKETIETPARMLLEA